MKIGLAETLFEILKLISFDELSDASLVDKYLKKDYNASLEEDDKGNFYVKRGDKVRSVEVGDFILIDNNVIIVIGQEFFYDFFNSKYLSEYTL